MTLFLVPSIVGDILFEASASFENGITGSVGLDHPIAQEPAIKAELEETCNLLGIDLSAVGNIVDYKKDDKGKFNVFYPAIKNVDGKACLVWGALVQDISTLNGSISFQGSKNQVVADFDVKVDDEVVIYTIPLRVNKDYAPALDGGSARVLNGRKKLHEALAEGFGKSNKTSDLEAGKYKIVEAKVTSGFKGAIAFNITIEGYGVYKAPNKVVKKLEQLGTEGITTATPWLLTLGEMVTAKIGGQDVSYREVLHVGTSNLGAIDFTKFKFDNEKVQAERLPAALLDLNAN